MFINTLYRDRARALHLRASKILEMLLRDRSELENLIKELSAMRDDLVKLIANKEAELSTLQFRLSEMQRKLKEINRAIADNTAANDNKWRR